MRLLHRFLDPHRRLKPLPPPHKSARVYSFAEAVVLQRNHERAKQLSTEFHTTNARSTA